MVFAQEVTHALNSLEDIFKTVGIGKSDIAFTMGAKVRPSDGGNARFFEQPR